MSPEGFAASIDHTLLKPEATSGEVRALVREALEYGFAAVCVNPWYVAAASEQVRASGGAIRVASVAGFPLGASTLQTKFAETRQALEDGADEIDMVIALGALIEGEHALVAEEISTLAAATHQKSGAILKVIIEAAALSDDQKQVACRLAADADADYVKTSTGFHPAGGATVADVKLMKGTTCLKVKASGGIRDADTALSLIAAGADRLGCSASVRILRELMGHV